MDKDNVGWLLLWGYVAIAAFEGIRFYRAWKRTSPKRRANTEDAVVGFMLSSVLWFLTNIVRLMSLVFWTASLPFTDWRESRVTLCMILRPNVYPPRHSDDSLF
jgi:hypothetical protein